MSGLMIGAALALALIQAAAPPQDPASDLPDVVVQGRIPEDLAREFIDQVAAPPRGATVARWNERVCVGVVNLPTETARFLIDRVSSVAMDLGLEPGEPGCDPVVVIVATVDGEAIARGLVERRRGTLAPGNTVQSRSRGELQAFAEGDRPVRWWHVSTAVDPVTGRSVVRDFRNENFNSNDPAEVIENLSRTVWGSTLESTVRQHLRRAVIIIDFDEVGDVDFNQLADYVAFVALAQVDPEGDTSAFQTILNVFDDPAATPGLTEWDRAYLSGLYNSDDSARGSSAREAALRREMLRAREAQGTPPEGE